VSHETDVLPPVELAVELPPLAPPLAAPPVPTFPPLPLLTPLAPPLEAPPVLLLPPLLPPLPDDWLLLAHPMDASPNAINAAAPSTMTLFMFFPFNGYEVALRISVSAPVRVHR
jgi:hypothetical protein